MRSDLRELWHISALPIIVFLCFLLAIGIYIHIEAVNNLNTPLKIYIRNDQDTFASQEEMDTESPLEEEENELTEFEEGVSEKTRIINAKVIDLIKSDHLKEALHILETFQQETNEEDVALTHFNKGLIQSRLGNYQAAIKEYREVLNKKPKHFNASFNLGTLYLTMRMNSEAIRILSLAKDFSGGEKKAKCLYNLAIAYSREGEYSKAEQAYLEVINLVPQDLKARINLAQIYRNKLKDFQKSEKMYQEVLRLDDQYPLAYYGLGTLRKIQSRFKEAQVLLEKAILLNPSHKGAREQLGLLFFEQGEIEKANEHFHWLEDNFPKSSGAYFYLGKNAYSQRNYKEAFEFYSKAFEISGKTNVESLNNMGVCLKAMGKQDKAMAAYLLSIKINPDYVNAYYNLGLLYIKKDDMYNALKYFKQTIEKHPEFEKAWYNLGFIYGLMDSNEESIKAYERAVKIKPSYLKARLNLGVQYKKTMDTTKAIEQYKIVTSINPFYASAWYNLALAEMKIGNMDEAEKAYKKAIELDPQSTKYRQYLSVLYSLLNRYNEANKILREALEINPEDMDLRYNLALQYMQVEKEALASEEFKKIVSFDPKHKNAWHALGRIHYKNKNYSDALLAFKKVIELDNEDFYTFYKLGNVYHRIKKYDNAIRYYKKSLKNIKNNECKNNEWIWYYLGKAYQAKKSHTKAEKAYKKSLALNPIMEHFIYNNNINETEDSIELLKKLLRDKPENQDLRLQLVKQLIREERTQEAKKELYQIVNAKQNTAFAWKTLGEIYLKEEDYENAYHALLKVKSLSSSDADAAYSLGKVLYMREKYKEAILHINYAIENMTNPQSAYILLADVHYANKNYEDAALAFQKARELNPLDPEKAYTLGKIYFYNKEYDKALQEFIFVAEKLPDFPEAGLWLGKTYLKLGQKDKAKEVFLKVPERKKSS